MVHAILGTVTGALAAAAALVFLYGVRPGLVLEMTDDPPRALVSGLYPVELSERESFAWTRPLTALNLRTVDRRREWSCTVRLRSPRPPGSPAPAVSIGIDGLTVATHTAGHTYEDVVVTAPLRAGAPLVLTIGTSPAFVPPSDPRELGVQLDRIACSPRGWVLPPVSALLPSAVAGAAFGTLFGLLARGVLVGAATLTFGLALALIVHAGAGMYSRSYLEWIAPVAIGVAAPAIGAAAWFVRSAPLAARFVLAFSAAVLCLKLLALLHPAKDVVDALFHAHRLEWVLAGRYFFTQPMPGGVQFPYAIGLYLSAAPFASFVRDHVALLRIVTCVVEALASAGLYLLVSKLWKDSLAGALAVVAWHLTPGPYVVIGNANLTYVFAQAMSTTAVTVAALLPGGRRLVTGSMLLLGVTTLAFLSHVGAFPVLAVTLSAAALLFWWWGDAPTRPLAVGIFAATVLAAVIAVGTYYAHFPEVYRTLDRVSAAQPDVQSPPSANAAPALSLPQRAFRAGTLGIRMLGVPLVIFSLVGAWLVARGRRDRLALTLGAWGAGFAIFIAARVVAPVDASLQRYADEFVERVYYATLPAIAVLAARAGAEGWRAGRIWRLAVLVLGAAAVLLILPLWRGWLA